MTPPLLEVSVNACGREDRVPARLLAEILDFCYRARRKKPARLDILVAGDAEMTRLNRRHLGHDGTTDVLSFADGEAEEGVVRLGDIAVGFEVAEREAGARGHSPDHELAFYALHGLLHLLGMDDATEAERRRMHGAQARIMRDFGLAWADE